VPVPERPRAERAVAARGFRDGRRNGRHAVGHEIVTGGDGAGLGEQRSAADERGDEQQAQQLGHHGRKLASVGDGASPARRRSARVVTFRGVATPGVRVTAYRYPDSHVFYRKLGRAFPRIVRGEGCWLIDEGGKRYLDAVGGAYVANLGHSNPDIADAMAQQARQFGYLSGTAFTHGPVEELAQELAATLPGDLDKLYFLSSGSEAVEAALKLARQYWVDAGRPAKHKIIALSPSYHGNTLLALSASAREHYRTLFHEWLVDVRRIPAPYPYRCACGGREPLCPACSGAALEAAILQEGPDSVAAFIAEPVGGSSTGASVPRPEYPRAVRAICDRHDVLFVADEILFGAGRTGTWWALERAGVTPDIMTLGKGITGGYAPH